MCQRARHSNQPPDTDPAMRMSVMALIATLLFAADASADCTSDVNDAFAKLRKSAAFAMDTKITNEQGTLTMSNDYVLPDRMHQRVSMSTGGPGSMEMILVGSKAWSNQGQGWAEVPEKFASTIAKQMKETVVEPPKDTSEFTCLGDVEFEGKTYAGYQAKRAGAAPDAKKDAASPAAATANVQTVYIDKQTGVPARNIVTPENDPNKRLFDGTFTVKDGLKIEVPKL
jgi:hypothetical protein